MFVDSFNRKVEYVRLSLTDRCNFRCVYCMPEGDIEWMNRRELLTFEELSLVATVLAANGIKRIRLTGGEPLLRTGIVELVTMLKDVGIESVGLTTNAFLLSKHAAPLKQAGLDDLNVSLDSLRPDRFKAITRNGDLGRVLAGIDAATAAGFERIKLNAVIVRSVNDDELLDLVEFARERDAVMRFIEFMPIGGGTVWGSGGCVPAAEMRRILAEHVTLVPDSTKRGFGPARYFSAGDATVGFISAVTECFCAGCNRIRIGATGAIRACLADDDEFSLRDAIRTSADPAAEIERVIRASLASKKEKHKIDIRGKAVTRTAMHAIGG